MKIILKSILLLVLLSGLLFAICTTVEKEQNMILTEYITIEHLEELADSVNNAPGFAPDWSSKKYFSLMNNIEIL